MANLLKLVRLVSPLCVCSVVFYLAGCSTPSMLRIVTDPDYDATFDDGMLVGGVMWGGEAALPLLGGYLIGDLLYQTMSGDSNETAPSSASDGPKPLHEDYPRQEEAKFLARLDGNRQVIRDMNGAEWADAQYYAIRTEARNLKDPNFDSSAYKIEFGEDDQVVGAVLNDTAFEEEPYTGAVIVKHPNSEQHRLVAFISRGIMMETGSLLDLNGTKRLSNKYDENGTLRETSDFDVKGTLRLARLYDGNGTLSEERVHNEKGTIQGQFLFGKNGRLKERNNYNNKGNISQRKIYEEIGSVEVRQFDEDGKRDFHKEGSIFVSDVRIIIVRLGLSTNPTKDNVPLIHDKHDLGKQIPGDVTTYAFPFTGTVLEFYDENRTLKKREESIVEGVHSGSSTWWHKNGSKQFEAEFLKGVPQGRTVWYRENGSVEYDGEWQDNKLVRATTRDTNDQQTGQVLNGNGILIYLHPNGQKRLEEIYTDGKLFETKWWDEEGNTVESVDPKKYVPNIPLVP